MNLAGLAADKAPPVEAPLGLFYLMPVFLGLAGLVLVVQGEQVLASRWTPAALAATHFIVLGALAPVMCGALLQIAPVLLGAPYPQVRLVACLTGAGLALGGLLVGGGFLAGSPALLAGGGMCAALGLTAFLAASYVALTTAAVSRRDTLWTARLAILALAVTIVLGLLLAMSRLGWVQLPHPRWTDAHVAWGLAGWVGLLLYGIGMELIPLFYITPPFARWLRRTLPAAVVCLLTLMLLRGLLPHGGGLPLAWIVIALFITFLVYTVVALRIEQRRQRPRRDASLWLWQASHASVLVAFVMGLGEGPQSVLGILLLGAAVSFVVGSLVKIVPFLSWLDLQQRRAAGHHQQVRMPRLSALLPERRANAIALTLAAAMVTLPAAGAIPPLVHVGGVMLVACALLLAYALAHAARLRQGVLNRFSQAPSSG